MPKSRMNTRLLASIIASTVFAGCGGGGDSGSGTSTPPPGSSTLPAGATPTAVACSPAQAGSTAAAPDNDAPTNTGALLPVGPLTHDGPATPEQIALLLPVTGALPDTATATARYRRTGSPQWLAAHPLFRVRPAFSEVPIAGGAVQDVFAWPIIHLAPGVSYDVEVAVRSAGSVSVHTLTHTTRSLPAAAGSPNKTANSALNIASQLAGLNPGDVLEIAAGTYDVDNLAVTRSGTEAQPIYIRGASRAGTVLRDTNGAILSIPASHVVIENMTLQGAGSDGGVS